MTPDLPRLQPHNVEAEQSVLGAILLDNSAMATAMELVAEEDFYRTAHQAIFRAMAKLSSLAEAIDSITLVEHLRADDHLASVGGAAYIAELVNAVPSAANITSHATIVREKSILRRTIADAQRLKDAAYHGAPLRELADRVAELRIPSTTSKSPGANATDAGNAIRFAAQHARNVRWCPQWKTWLVWDGKRWAKDTKAHVMQLAKQTARSIFDEARTVEDDERRRKLAAWAVTSESVKHLTAMLELAKSEDGIPVEPTELDQDTWLLNAENGMIDLHTGALLPHDRDRLITKLTPIVYDPHATCQTWTAFLLRITNSDEELITFLRVAFGYSLTACVREQVLFLLHGAGSNGKSTLIRILLALLGDYALQTPSETLLLSRQDGAVRNDLARFAGARVVAAMESDGGRKLASALIKQLTGNDVLTARFLFSEYFEIVPTWKIWFSTNHRPIITDDGDALWRRPKLIPFSVQIPEDEQDKDLPTKLTQELPGILAWAVQGCLEWQQHGLKCPVVVQVATRSYREAESTFEHFLHERCVCEAGANVKFSDLRTAYTSWTEEASDKPLTSKMFAAALSEHGFQPTRQHNARCYRGLRLRTISDELAEVQMPVGATQGDADVDLD